MNAPSPLQRLGGRIRERRQAARERARMLEARLERGEDTGPLTGWTFSVKDAMRQAGYP